MLVAELAFLSKYLEVLKNEGGDGGPVPLWGGLVQRQRDGDVMSCAVTPRNIEEEGQEEMRDPQADGNFLGVVLHEWNGNSPSITPRGRS